MMTVLQDSQYQTPLTDRQIYTTYPSEIVDYVVVKKCIVNWSLKIIENESGVDKFVPLFKNVEIHTIIKRFINEEDTEDIFKKFIINGKNVSIEENDNFTLPFKPINMEINIDSLLNCNKCVIDFYDYSK